MTDNYVKLLIKVLNPAKDKADWTHFCYVDKNLYNKYVAEEKVTTNDFNEILCRWCKEDFNVDIPMSDTKDIALLKAVVKDFFHRAYPDFCVDGNTDRRGWLRVWVTRKMREELGLYGEERI